MNLRDLDFVKANCTKIHAFGLGFIQIKLGQDLRIHVYDKQFITSVEEIHNHRYNFSSLIMAGRFLQTRYYTVKGDTHTLGYESCDPDKEIPLSLISRDVGIKAKSEEEYHPGDLYTMCYFEFHTVNPDPGTITLLTRGAYDSEYAQVIRPKGAEAVCPFSANTYSEKELWGMVEKQWKL